MVLFLTCLLISNITQEPVPRGHHFLFPDRPRGKVSWALNRVLGLFCGPTFWTCPVGHPLMACFSSEVSFFLGFFFFAPGEGLLPGTAIVFGNEPPGLVNKLHFIPPCHFWLGEHQEMKAETSKALLLTQSRLSHFQTRLVMLNPAS